VDPNIEKTLKKALEKNTGKTLRKTLKLKCEWFTSPLSPV